MPPQVLSLTLDHTEFRAPVASATMTIVFSEAVSGVAASGFSVDNGTLQNLATTDNITWTATFTPNANVSDASNTISFAAYTVRDAAGNAGMGSFQSPNYAINSFVSAYVTSVALEDNGISATDGLTSIAQQTITGSFSGTIPDGSAIEILVNGVSVGNADIDATNHSFSFNGGVLQTGSNDVSVHVKDAAGNASADVHQAITLDTAAPTAAVSSTSVADPLTITFSEAVYLDPDKSGSITLDDGTHTVNITPTDAMFSQDHLKLTIQGANTLLDNHSYFLLLPGNLTDAAGNPVPSQVDFSTGADGHPHALSAEFMTEGKFHTGAVVEISVLFDEAVTIAGTPTLELNISGNLRNASYFSGSGSTTLVFQYTVLPTDNDDFINLSSATGLVGTIKDGDGNLLDAAHILFAAPSGTASVDNTPPEPVALTIYPASFANDDTATVTLKFTEAVQGVDLANFTVGHGTLSDLASTDNVTWTATFTPDAGVTAASNLISFDTTTVSDAAGKHGTGSVTSGNYTIDTVAPAVTSLTLDDSSLTAGQSATLTLVMSEQVTGVSTSSFGPLNGTLSAPVSADGGKTWTATLTPTANTTELTNSVSFDAATVGDLAGNAGSGVTMSANYVIDTARPTATVTLGDSILHAGETTTVTVTFSEAVTGLTDAAFSAPGGVISNVSTANGGGITWTATFTPDASTSTSSNSLAVDLSGVTDARGNAGTGSASFGPYTVDTIAPTPTSISLDKTVFKDGDTATATIVFSEAISTLTTDAFTVDNGSLSNLHTSDNVTWTADFTPTTGSADSTNVIVVNGGGVQDLAGNTGTGTASTTNYTLDAQAPTLTHLGFSDIDVGVGDTPTVTLEFSEAVSNVLASGFSAGGGSIGTPTTSDGGLTWTALFTPTADQPLLSTTIAFDASTVTDAAGNAGSGSLDANYSVDTSVPLLASVNVDAAVLNAADTATVTVVFSEAVSGFSLSNFSFNGGTLADLDTTDNITWTATLTPNTEVSSSAIAVTVSTTGVTDSVGNAATGGPLASDAFVIDTTLPDITGFSVDKTTLRHGETATVTLEFSEPVSGISLGSLTVENGTLSDLATTDHQTYTAVLTATDGTDDSTNVVTVTGTVQDDHGNTVNVSDTSTNYAVDTIVTNTISTLGFVDNGVSSTDFLTNTVAQTVSGTYSGTLAADAHVEVKVNDGDYTQVSNSGAEFFYSGGGFMSGSNTVLVRVADSSGHTGPEYSATLTIDTTGPALQTGQFQTDVDPGTDLVLAFDQDLYSTNGAATVTLNGGPVALSYTLDQLTISGGTVTIPTAGDLKAGYNYTLSLPYALTDDAGNGYYDSISFSTEAAVHATAATYTVNDGWTTLNTGGTLSFTVDFGESVTVTGDSKLLFETGSQDGYATIAQGSSGSSLTYTYTVQSGEYTSSLSLNADFAAALVAGLTDARGNALDSAFVDFSSLTNSGTGSGVIVDTPPLASSITGLGQNSDFMDTDVGWSSTDGITLYTMPNLAGSGARPNATVEIYEGSTLLGSGSADANGDYNIRLDDAGALSGGAHNVHAVVLSSSSVAGASSSDYTITIDTSALSISGAAAQANDGTVSFTFSEAVQWTEGASFTILESDQTTVAATIDSAHVSISGNTVTLDPGAALSDTTLYYIEVPTSLTDIGGHTLSGNPSFTTLDLTAPVVSTESPTAGGLSGSYVSLTFSEEVLFKTNTHIYVKDVSTGTALETLDGLSTGTSGTDWTLSTDQSGKSTLSIHLSGLTDGNDYYVEFDSDAVTDTAGNECVTLVGGNHYQFTYSAQTA